MNTSDKLVRFGRILNIIGIVLAIFCLLAAAGSLVVAIVVVILPESLVHDLFDSLKLTSSVGLFQAGTSLGDFIPTLAITGLKLTLVLAAVSSFLYCLVAAIILFILSAVFRSTAIKHSPFLPENVKRLKIIGVILIIASLLLGLSNLIYAFCLLALAYVFQYGMELQQQADETL